MALNTLPLHNKDVDPSYQSSQPRRSDRIVASPTKPQYAPNPRKRPVQRQPPQKSSHVTPNKAHQSMTPETTVSNTPQPPPRHSTGRDPSNDVSSPLQNVTPQTQFHENDRGPSSGLTSPPPDSTVQEPDHPRLEGSSPTAPADTSLAAEDLDTNDDQVDINQADDLETRELPRRQTTHWREGFPVATASEPHSNSDQGERPDQPTESIREIDFDESENDRYPIRHQTQNQRRTFPDPRVRGLIQQLPDRTTRHGYLEAIKRIGTGYRVIVNRGTDSIRHYACYPGSVFGKGSARNWIAAYPDLSLRFAEANDLRRRAWM